jgi:hypothetical protein
MPRFDEFDENYTNVNDFADSLGLLWDGLWGSPDVRSLIDPRLLDLNAMHEYRTLFDHTKCFKPKGRGARRNVLAISSPYQADTGVLRRRASEFAERMGLEVLVNHTPARIYVPVGTIPIVFWRRDLFTYSEGAPIASSGA